MSSGNVGKYEFLTGKDIFSEKDVLEKAVTMKRFEYSLLVSDFKEKNQQLKNIIYQI